MIYELRDEAVFGPSEDVWHMFFLLGPIQSHVMWRDWKERRTELIDKAKFFEYEGYPNTGKWIRYAAEQIISKRPVADLPRDLDDMLDTWRIDYTKGNAARQALFGAIWPRAFEAAKSPLFATDLLKLDSVIRELAANAQNLSPISKAFMPFKGRDRKTQFYGICIHYLLDAEGIFDDAVKTLYGLVLISENQSIPAKLGNMTTWQVRNKLEKHGVPDLIFDGWQDNHVRNSIGHCRFRYDDKSGKMRFVDVKTGTGKVTYDKVFTLEEFSDLYFKLDDVWHILQNILFMLRVIQLVLAPKVPRVGKDLFFH